MQWDGQNARGTASILNPSDSSQKNRDTGFRELSCLLLCAGSYNWVLSSWGSAPNWLAGAAQPASKGVEVATCALCWWSQNIQKASSLTITQRMVTLSHCGTKSIIIWSLYRVALPLPPNTHIGTTIIIIMMMLTAITTKLLVRQYSNSQQNSLFSQINL